MSKELALNTIAPEALLLNDQSQEVKLSDFWAQGPTLLTFLRHFGCIFCREWLKELEKHKTEFLDAGLQIVAVGQGEPKHVVRYCHTLAPGVNCLVRDDTTAYKAYGVYRSGVKNFLTADFVKAGFRAAMSGSMQGATTGDTAMNPANFIVGVDGSIQYAYYGSHPGDHPAIADLIKAAGQLRV